MRPSLPRAWAAAKMRASSVGVGGVDERPASPKPGVLAARPQRLQPAHGARAGARSSGSTGSRRASAPSARTSKADVDDRAPAAWMAGRRRLAARAATCSCRKGSARRPSRPAARRRGCRPRAAARPPDDLGELAGDVVEVAAVEADLARPRLWSWARMPSYLSSTQTGGAQPRQRLRLVGDRRGQHGLEGVEERQARARRARRRAPARAVRPMSPVSMPAHWTAARSRPKAAAMAASR